MLTKISNFKFRWGTNWKSQLDARHATFRPDTWHALMTGRALGLLAQTKTRLVKYRFFYLKTPVLQQKSLLGHVLHCDAARMSPTANGNTDTCISAHSWPLIPLLRAQDWISGTHCTGISFALSDHTATTQRPVFNEHWQSSRGSQWRKTCSIAT